MKPETLEALKLSIQKWAGIVAGTTADQGSLNCALCRRFDLDSVRPCTRSDGERCPVYIASASPNCYQTPYTDMHPGVERDVAELEFLQSLLPEGES